MKRYWLAIQAAFLIIVVGFFYLYFGNDGQRLGDVESQLLFPNLIDLLNEVQEIKVITNQHSSTVKLENSVWVVDELQSYPAKIESVRDFLVGFSQLRKVEPKTNDPNKYEALGLAGVGMTDSETIEIALRAKGGSHLARLHIGKMQALKVNSLQNLHYVRYPENSQTWLVRGVPEIPSNPTDWIELELIDLDSRSHQVEIVRFGQNAVKVFRDSPQNKDFELAGLATNQRIRYQYRLNQIGEFFKALRLKSVISLNDWIENGKIVVDTFDGLSVTASVGGGNNQNFIVLRAHASGTAQPNIVEESNRLNQRWRGWAFEIPNARAEVAALEFDDLIELNASE